MRNAFRYFNSSPEVIRPAVMLYIRYLLALRQVVDLLFERGIDICYQTVRLYARDRHRMAETLRELCEAGAREAPQVRVEPVQAR